MKKKWKEKGNIKEIAEAIVDVYQNIDHYNVNDLRAIADRYSAKNVTDLAIKVYQELLEEK